jgi:disulfide bond formation protein DsbB
MSIYNNLLRFFTARGNKYFYLGLASISIISLSYAFFVEYILGFEPCILCLYQRIPYFLLIILSISGAIFPNKKQILYFLAIIIFAAICLAAYHTGVERAFFDPTATCNMGVRIPDNISLEEVRELLYNAPIANCTVASYKIFKLSMTEWNLIMNICLIIGTIIIIRNQNATSLFS